MRSVARAVPEHGHAPVPVRLMVDRPGIAAAAQIIARGGVLVYPTDTVYGLGCRPQDPTAVQRILDLKGRKSKPLPVLVADAKIALQLVSLGPEARALARRLWPGAVTLVARLRFATLPAALHGPGGTLGVRVPGLTVTRRLLRACGGALVGTSANRSGEPAPRDPSEVAKTLALGYDALVDGGPTPLGAESTVVDVTGPVPRILRQGYVPAWQVWAALPGDA